MRTCLEILTFCAVMFILMSGSAIWQDHFVSKQPAPTASPNPCPGQRTFYDKRGNIICADSGAQLKGKIQSAVNLD